MVKAPVLMGTLEGHHVAGVFHRQERRGVTVGGGADAAEGFLGQVEAIPAGMKLGAGFHQGPGQGLGSLRGPLQHVKGQALGGPGTDTRKLFQFVEKAL
jgi:hypothetical protein